MVKTLIDHSKTKWTVDLPGYPGDENIKLGCLQRIADATEAMAVNHVKLQSDLEWYKKNYALKRDYNDKLIRRISALHGVITKMKKSRG